MKILHLSTSDTSGGAARACYRLHMGLLEMGHDSRILAQYIQTNDPTIVGPTNNLGRALAHLRTAFDHLPKTLYRNRKPFPFHLQWLPDRIMKTIRRTNPDIVHLHWICRGFLNINTIRKIRKPIVWTLHDLWPFTGGCHYPGDCYGYKKSCGSCPQIGSRTEKDISRCTWHRKSKFWKNIDITLVAPSNWMKNKARESSLFGNKTIELIPNGINSTLFSPENKCFARKVLGFSQRHRLVLFGAMDPILDQRKGFHLLKIAIEHLAKKEIGKEIELIIVGAANHKIPPEFNMKALYTGALQDEVSIALVNQACDVMVCPSIQENLPNTIMEAMACGVPCVGFDIGGISEMINDRKTGYLAKPFDPKDLANGIAWVLSDALRFRELSDTARKKAQITYDIISISRQMSELYERKKERNHMTNIEDL